MKCSQCGTNVDSGMRFCTQCGAPLTKVCPACGTVVPYGSAFCTNCGTHLEQTDGRIERGTVNPTENFISSTEANEDDDFWPKMTNDKYRNRLVITTRVLSIALTLVLLLSFLSAYGYQHIYGWKWVIIGGFVSGIVIGSIGLSAGGYMSGERLKKYDTTLKENGKDAAKEVAKFKVIDYLCIVAMVLTVLLTPGVSDYLCSSMAKRYFINPDAGFFEILLGE